MSTLAKRSGLCAYRVVCCLFVCVCVCGSVLSPPAFSELANPNSTAIVLGTYLSVEGVRF